MSKKIINGLFVTGILLFSISCIPQSDIAKYNVVWESQSLNSRGTMPIGNGDVGSNVWVSPAGELMFYISKSDAWSENGRLLKIGKIKIRFTPNLLVSGNFRQELDLKTGMIKITGSQGNEHLSLSLWVDIHFPVMHIEGKSSVPVTVDVIYDGWRTGRRELKYNELHSAYGIIRSPDPVIVEPDTVLPRKNCLIWCHHNSRSIWKETLRVQAIGQFAEIATDPLLNRTFGAFISGPEFINKSPRELTTKKATKKIDLNVFALTESAESVKEWETSIVRLAGSWKADSAVHRKANHRDYWKNFWKNSYIIVGSATDNEKISGVTRGYLLQRYMNACGSRGNMPVKFNGSIFNVDSAQADRPYDADYRAWGGCYWWQNTRIPYWSMIYSGDFELMRPLFKMYMDALPLAKFRTNVYYGHLGAYFPETMYFWGTWNNDNYGWDREGKPDGLSDNKYIRYEWQGGIELIAMMLDYYEFVPDKDFLTDTLLPFASEILAFYREHYRKNQSGKILFEPAQALETYWEGTVNPMPEIAGLRFILPKLIQLGTDPVFKETYSNMFSEMPEIPIGEKNGGKVLLAGEKLGPKNNLENPELYAIFPYRHYGVGKPGLDLAQRTYAQRIHKTSWGWQQNAIQAALIGETDQAAAMVMENFNTKNKDSRFPAFWGPNYDWIPDQDHGGVNMRALQNMLIQTEGDTIYMFPAWPETWNVKFKVHAPKRTTIEGEFKNGKIIRMKVNPASRKKDIRFSNK